MKAFLATRLAALVITLILVGCSGAQPNYRAAEQRATADKAQKELSREVKKSTY